MLLKQLEKIGLDKKEASVYLALLELGEANVAQITKKSKNKRTTVYDVLSSLKGKGLIGSSIYKKNKLYFAENPKIIEKKLEEKQNILKEALPELLSIANLLDKKPCIQYFDGEAGIKTIFYDALDYPNREILAWFSQDYANYFDTSFIENDYIPKRLKNKIFVRGIASDNKKMREYQSFDQKVLRKTKLVSQSQFPLDVHIQLHGSNKIGIVSFAEEFGLLIESKQIFSTLRSIFEMNWNN